jgi:hypothetical protein
MISIRPSAVDAPEAVALVRSYLKEMVDRYHGRPMPESRKDLAEARAMYAPGGYAEIPAHRDRRYADHWFAKDLKPRPG